MLSGVSLESAEESNEPVKLDTTILGDSLSVLGCEPSPLGSKSSLSDQRFDGGGDEIANELLQVEFAAGSRFVPAYANQRRSGYCCLSPIQRCSLRNIELLTDGSERCASDEGGDYGGANFWRVRFTACHSGYPRNAQRRTIGLGHSGTA